MNIIEKYLCLANEKRFSEGLPLIEDIVRRNPNNATSQFNYGICLFELSRYRDAAQAFLNAYRLNPNDGGALYRGCIALATEDNAPGLLAVFQEEYNRDPEILEDFLKEERFAKFWILPEFAALKKDHAKNK